jgi:hypothetical protein
VDDIKNRGLQRRRAHRPEEGDGSWRTIRILSDVRPDVALHQRTRKGMGDRTLFHRTTSNQHANQISQSSERCKAGNGRDREREEETCVDRDELENSVLRQDTDDDLSSCLVIYVYQG